VWLQAVEHLLCKLESPDFKQEEEEKKKRRRSRKGKERGM
jgi:hypothetical protein